MNQDNVLYLNRYVKPSAAYLLLLLYAMVIVKPVLPLISDWWEHSFHELEHLALVHAIHGDHHAEHEMAEAAEHDDDHQDHPKHLLPEDQVSFHLLAAAPVASPPLLTTTTVFHRCGDTALFFTNLSLEAPPPKR